MATTIYADRSKIPGPTLSNISIVRLLDPTTDFEIPIMSKADGQEAVLLSTVKFQAPTTPVPPVVTGDALYD